MNLHPVDVRLELRQGVQRRFDLAPVVIFLPITREFAHRRELHALRCICHRFLLRPLCRGDPPAEVRQRFVGHTDMERGGSTSPLRSRLLRPRRGSRARALAQRSRRRLPQNTSFRRERRPQKERLRSLRPRRRSQRDGACQSASRVWT